MGCEVLTVHASLRRAVVQALGGVQGFLFLANRRMGSGHVGASPVGIGKAPRLAVAAMTIVVSSPRRQGPMGVMGQCSGMPARYATALPATDPH
jgi:hypothetical protein